MFALERFSPTRTPVAMIEKEDGNECLVRCERVVRMECLFGNESINLIEIFMKTANNRAQSLLHIPATVLAIFSSGGV